MKDKTDAMFQMEDPFFGFRRFPGLSSFVPDFVLGISDFEDNLLS
jgi:hypothetical protein